MTTASSAVKESYRFRRTPSAFRTIRKALMPVDPFLEPLLGSLEPMPADIPDFDAWRAQGATASAAMALQLAEPGPEVASTDTVFIPVDSESVEVRIYTPHAREQAPVHLFLHGGGWVAGSIDDTFTDITCRERAVGAGCTVVAVNYRKAPEHKHPTALNDCYAVLEWVAGGGGELGLRSDHITVGGQSAGANLAAGLCLKARDLGGPAIAFQLLEVPALDLTLSQPSLVEYATGYGLTTSDISRFVDYYLSDPRDAVDAYVSPLRAPDLSLLPVTHVMAAEYDPLRDDGEAFVERLRASGVRATFSLQHGHIHGSAAFTAVMDSARAWRDEAIRVLRAAH